MKHKLLFLFLFSFSLTYAQIDLGPNIEACTGSTVVLDASIPGESPFYTWVLNDTTILPESGPTLNVTQAGRYYVETIVNNVAYTDEIIVYINDEPEIWLQEFSVCDDDIIDGFASFDLNSIVAQTTLDFVNNTVTFYETEADALADVNPIISPYTNTNNFNQTIYIRLQNANGGCFSVNPFYLSVLDNSVMVNNPTPLTVCSQTDFTTFNLSSKNSEINNEANVNVTYFLTQTDADANVNPLPNLYDNMSNPQTVYARVQNQASACFRTTQLELIVNDGVLPQANGVNAIELCDTPFNFDLTVFEATIIGGQTDVTISFFETSNDAVNNVNNITNPNAYTGLTMGQNSVYARVDSNLTDCYNYTEISITVNALPISNPTSLFGCANDASGITSFDLASQVSLITTEQNVDVMFFETEADALNNVNIIASPNAYVNIINPQIIYVRVEDVITGCFSTTTLELNVEESPQLIEPTPIEVCDDDNDGFSVFNLDSKTAEILGANDPISYTVTFHETQFDTDSGTNPITSPYTNIVSGFQTVFVRVENINVSQCYSTTTLDLVPIPAPTPANPTPLIACDENGNGIIEFDLTTKTAEIINGEVDLDITYHVSLTDAENNINSIVSPYTTPGIVYVRASSIVTGCYTIVELLLIVETCPEIIDCTDIPFNFEYCYDVNDSTQYNFESSDGSPLILSFNAGQVEFDYDSLVVLDSDGITNLNTSAPYGNNGDLSGLVFTSSGNRISVYVDSDEIISCATENYTPINFNVSCFDATAIPNCDAVLTLPANNATDVSTDIALVWTEATDIVTGYKLTIGTTSGGTDIYNNVDIGAVTTLSVSSLLDFETTYFVTIIPYNDNGDAINCTEYNFTTESNPSIIVCNALPVNTEYCYVNNDTTEFYFESEDGSPLTVVFNSGTVEEDFDSLLVLDSDGTTNLNSTSPYGNAGDVSNLVFTSTGGSLTITVDADGIESCEDYDEWNPLNFDVFCANAYGIITVSAFEDLNANGTLDTNEPNFSNGFFTYELNNDGNISSVNSSTGSFNIYSENDIDSYDITFNLFDGYTSCYTATSGLINDVSVATGSILTLDIPVVQDSGCEDLGIYLINPNIAPRPGFSHNNILILENLGNTTIASGTVEFIHDAEFAILNTASSNAGYIITNYAMGFTVDFTNLLPGESEEVVITLSTAVSTVLGTLVTNEANYTTTTNDLILENNTTTLSEVVIGSWDPNDKMEAHGPQIVFNDFLASDEYLYYTIRFQNLGTADAVNVRIEDELNSQLDETTFEMLRSSHDYVVTKTDSDIEWLFQNINLPAEQDDAFGSQGYVYFKIKPKSGYAVNDIIPNSAGIYFDFNAPVITNIYETQFIETLSLRDIDSNYFSLYPNPAKDIVTIKLNSNKPDKIELTIIDIHGKSVLQSFIYTSNNAEIDISKLSRGMYFVELKSVSVVSIKKLILD